MLRVVVLSPRAPFACLPSLDALRSLCDARARSSRCTATSLLVVFGKKKVEEKKIQERGKTPKTRESVIPVSQSAGDRGEFSWKVTVYHRKTKRAGQKLAPNSFQCQKRTRADRYKLMGGK